MDVPFQKVLKFRSGNFIAKLPTCPIFSICLTFIESKDSVFEFTAATLVRQRPRHWIYTSFSFPYLHVARSVRMPSASASEEVPGERLSWLDHESSPSSENFDPLDV